MMKSRIRNIFDERTKKKGIGAMETTFSLDVTKKAEVCYLKYQGESRKTVKVKVLEGVAPGVVYGFQAANLGDVDSILFIVAVDYHGMPFGSGYWEMYSWRDRKLPRCRSMTWKGITSGDRTPSIKP